MASPKSTASVEHTIIRIEELRQRVAGARSDNRRSLGVYNAFEFDIIQKALELLRGTLSSGLALEQSQKDR